MMLSQNALLTEAGEIHMKHEILKKQHRLPTVRLLGVGTADTQHVQSNLEKRRFLIRICI